MKSKTYTRELFQMTNKQDQSTQCAKDSGKRLKPPEPANPPCTGKGLNCGPCLGHAIIRPFTCGHNCPKCTNLYLVKAKDSCSKWVNIVIRADSGIQACYLAERLVKNVHYTELIAEKIEQ